MAITVKVKRGGILYSILRRPIVHRQPDLSKAQGSRWTYGLGDDGVARLTPLGVLHTLIGLTLWVED